MARAGITYSEVTKAISALQGAGKKITIETIRQFLGTGSHSTISKHLNDWRKDNEIGILEQGENLPEEVLAFTKGLWQRLHEAAQVEISKQQQDAAVKIQESRQLLTDTKKILEEKKLLLHDAEEKLQQSLMQQKNLNDQLNATENKNSRLTERVNNLENNLNQWENKHNKLHELLKTTQKNLEHYQEESQKLREKQAIFNADKERAYQIKLDELLKIHTDELNKKSFYEAELKRVEKLNVQLEKANEEMNKSLKTVDEELQRTKINFEWLSKQNEQLETQNGLKTKELKEAGSLLAEYKSEIKIAKENMLRLEKAAQEREAKIETLRQDNLFLNQEKANLSGQFTQLQAVLYQEKLS